MKYKQKLQNKVGNKVNIEKNVVVEQEFSFPEHSITIRAVSMDEAIKKLNEVLDSKKKGGDK